MSNKIIKLILICFIILIAVIGGYLYFKKPALLSENRPGNLINTVKEEVNQASTEKEKGTKYDESQKDVEAIEAELKNLEKSSDDLKEDSLNLVN